MFNISINFNSVEIKLGKYTAGNFNPFFLHHEGGKVEIFLAYLTEHVTKHISEVLHCQSDQVKSGKYNSKLSTRVFLTLKAKKLKYF